MDKEIIKKVILEQGKPKENNHEIQREQLALFQSLIPLSHIIIISGIRRCGKSTIMRQILNKYYENDFYFVDFEDERLLDL